MTLDFLPVALGFFLCVSSSIQLSVPFAEQNYQKAPQVFADLLRFCIILGVLVPAALLPVAKPLMRWVQGDSKESDVEQG
jgi:Na+-driven multidrug efflux pump